MAQTIAHTHTHTWGPTPPSPELAGLVDAGTLGRAAARDAGARDGGTHELAETGTRRGIVTGEQARALARLLGLGTPRDPANDRA